MLRLAAMTLKVTLYDTMPQSSPHWRTPSPIGKQSITFSDMIVGVRLHLSMNWVFDQRPIEAAVQKLTPQIRQLIGFGLTQATYSGER